MSPAGQLVHRVSWVRDHLRKRAAFAAACWGAAGVALVLMVAWTAAGNDGWRQGSNLPVVLDALIVVWIVAGLGVFRAGVRKWFDEVPLSKSIELAAGMHPGVVRGSLELSRAVPAGVSDALAARAVSSAVSNLEGRAARELAGELGRRVALWTRRGMIVASVSVVALVALGIATPDRTANAWAGVSSPFSTMIDPVLPAISVSPGSIEVMRGTDVVIEVEAEGRIAVELVWQAAGDVVRTRSLEVVQGRATHVFQAVSATTDYRVRAADGVVTDSYRIVPIDPLFVSDLVIGVTYPPHTGLEPDEYRGDAPPLRLPAGSRLTFEGLASRPLSTVDLVDSLGASTLSFEVDGPAFEAGWTPVRDGVFSWSFRDGAGAAAEIQPEPLELLLVPDVAPTVSILLPGQDTILPLSLRQPLVVDARDDYGLTRVELVAYRVTAFGERQQPVVHGLDLAGTRAALARPALDVTTWGLLPGDTVRYFVRVVDNSPARQTGVSAEYALRMPDVAELRREAEATLDGVAERLEELRAEEARQADANADQALEAAARTEPQDARSGDPNEPGFEQREELRRALEEQAALLGELDTLRADLEALQRSLEEAGQADPELAADLEQLQELLRQLAGEELRERMEDVAQALQQESREEANRSLEELAREQERLRERLEAALEEFQRAAVEQDFRATTDETEELARQQRALADAMREEDDPELRAEQQAELADRAEELEERMEALAQQLSELDEQDAAAGVEEARQMASEAREQMREAEQQATQGDSQDAGAQAEQAADQLEEAASQLQEAQAEQAEQTAEQAEAAMQQTADDALALARRQDELRERMQGASQEELSQMRGDEASLMRGLENVAENLQAGTEATGGDPAVSAQVGRAMESIQGTMEALESRRSSPSEASQQAEQAVGELNQLAMMAMAGAAEGGSPSPGQSGQDVAEQVGQLAQRQGELLAQAGDMAPMRLGEQAMAQQVSQLSEKQAAVARELGNVSRQPGAGESLGDLGLMAQEAELLARQLDQGRLTPEIVRRQERLFHRLLDAGRSLEREEFSEDRESEAPGTFEPGDVTPLSADQLGLMPYELPDGQQLRRLSPAVRQLVLEYFERLNRKPAGDEGLR